MRNALTMEQVFEAIRAERAFQDTKYGQDRAQSLPGFILIAEAELSEAKLGWCKNLPGKSAPLNELVQVAAVCVAALERYGVEGCTRSTNDIPNRPLVPAAQAAVE
jgi:hypothetical protein